MSSTATIHIVAQGSQYCSCGQDAVTCQGCGRTVCGDVAVWTALESGLLPRSGNVGTCCFAKFGFGHQGSAQFTSELVAVVERTAAALPRNRFSDIDEITNSDIPAEFQTYAPMGEAFDNQIRRFKKWCKETSTFYYARPRESFSTEEAYRLAAAAGCSRLLMEDMS